MASVHQYALTLTVKLVTVAIVAGNVAWYLLQESPIPELGIYVVVPLGVYVASYSILVETRKYLDGDPPV